MESIRSGERQSAADNDAMISSSEIEWQGRLAQQMMGSVASDGRHASQMRQREADAMQRYRVQQTGSSPMMSPTRP